MSFENDKKLVRMPSGVAVRTGLCLPTALLVLVVLSAAASAQALRLSTAQEKVYKLADSTKLDSESWMFYAIVDGNLKAADVSLTEARIELVSGGAVKETTVLPADVVTSMRRNTFSVTDETPVGSIRRRYSRTEIFDLRFDLLNKPIAWKTDLVRLTLRLTLADKKELVLTANVPIETYVQKTELFSPIKGPAIVSQGRFNNGGHSGFGNQFAIDLLGLSTVYGPMNRDGEANADYAGWGREIFAAASGEVVYARNDVPDNPPNTDPATVFSKEPNPIDATAGNAVIIGHGNDEFSVVMHLQKGSVRVKKGDKVRKGEVIGLLGNSGDSFGPHLHFQLQKGPELFKHTTLPFEFADLKGRRFARGEYFSAK